MREMYQRDTIDGKYPSTSGWVAEEKSIGWKLITYSTNTSSCSCKHTQVHNCFKPYGLYGIFLNAH